jgi:4-amino-4-deoxychorismate lyase
MTGLTLINGRTDDRIESRDRGLAYGHGVFETILMVDGQLTFLDWHLERLLEGCRRLHIPDTHLSSLLRTELAALPATEAGVVKIIVTAGSGGRGYAVPQPCEPLRVIQCSELPHWPEAPAQNGVRLRWCQTRLAQQPQLAGIKHLNRLEQVLARAEWQDPAIREGLVLDTAGHVIEGTMSNLFWISGNILHTPALNACGVAGILRRWVLTVAPTLGLETRLGQYRPDALDTADELFICNSLAGIWPAVQLEQRAFEIGPHTRALQALLNKEYELC